MRRNENPCKPDCKERSATCHGTCPQYAKWREALREESAKIYQNRYEDTHGGAVWTKSTRKRIKGRQAKIK